MNVFPVIQTPTASHLSVPDRARTCLFLCLSALLGTSLIGCSAMKATEAKTTPFLAHSDELHPWPQHAPWDEVWPKDPSTVMARSETVRDIYISAVDTTYLNHTKDPSGIWVETYHVEPEDIQKMADLIRASFSEAIRSSSTAETNLRLIETPHPHSLRLDIALVELRPTSVALNAAADAGGLLLPGSKLIEEAAAVGAQAAGGAIAAGTIAIEFRLVENSSNEVIAEAKDREEDPSSIIPNYRDFEKFGWSRETAQNWAKEFVLVFGSSSSTKVDDESHISVAPW